MRIVDAIQHYQAIVYEVELGDNLVRIQARKDLSLLSTALTKRIGPDAVKAIMEEAQQIAQNEKRSVSK